MTKQLRKGLMTVLLFVMAIVCAFSASTLFARADDTATTQKSKFNEYLTKFEQLAETDGTAGLTEAELLAAMSNKEANANFRAMYNHVSNGYATNAADEDTYSDIKALYNEESKVVDLYSGLSSTAYSVIYKNGYSYKDAPSVAALRESYNNIATNYAAYLGFLKGSDLVWDNTEDEPELLVQAEATIKGWRDDIVAAIARIQEIEVTVDGNNKVAVWNATDYLADYDVVIESKETFDKATAAIAKIASGDIKYLTGTDLDTHETGAKNHKAIYDDVDLGLKAQYAKIEEVEMAILAVYGLPEHPETEKEVTLKAKVFKTNGTGAIVNCYTIREDIKAVDKKYEELNGGSLSANLDLNKLYNYVNEDIVDMLEEMTNADDPATAENEEGELERVTKLIKGASDAIDGVNENGVEDVIAAIGTVLYDAETQEDIAAARTAFDALPQDVKDFDNDDARNNDYCVVNYNVLLKAEADWTAYVTAVTNLINAVKALPGSEAAHPENIYAEISAVMTMYGALKDQANQLAGDATATPAIIGFNNTAVEEFNPLDKNGDPIYKNPITTCAGLYSHYADLASQINTATKDINDGLVDLVKMDVRFTAAFDDAFKDIDNKIAKLPTETVDGEVVLDRRYVGAIDEYDTFLEMKAEYTELHRLAGLWIEAVKAIGEVCVAKFDEIALAVTAYETDLRAKYPVDSAVPATWTLDSDIEFFNYKYSDGITYATYYTTYTQALAAKTSIITALDELKVAANALDGQRDDADFATDVVDVTAKYNALHCDECRTYFRGEDPYTANTEYAAAYEVYRTALIYVQANAIETEIAKIFATHDPSVTDLNFIAKARAAYDNYEVPVAFEGVYTVVEVKNAVRNYDDNDKADVDTLVDAEYVITTWISNVNALLNNANFAGDAIVDAGNVKVEEITLTNIEKDLFRINVINANNYKADWDNNVLSDVMKAYDNATEAYELLSKIIVIAGTVYDVQTEAAAAANSKLNFIQKHINGFVDAYAENKKYAEAEYTDIKAWIAALDATQKALLHVADFQKIESDELMAAGLAKAIDELYKIVVPADGKVTETTADSVVQYYIISAFYDSLLPSQQALVKVTCATDVATALAAIKASLDPVDYDFATIVKDIADLKDRYTDAEVDSAITTAIANALTKDDGVIKLALAQVLKDAKDYADEIVANLSKDGGAIKVNAEAISAAVGRIQSLESAVNALDDTYATDAQLSDAIAALSGADGAITKAKEAAIEKAKELVKELNDKLYDATEGDIVKIKADIVKIKADIVDIIEKMATDEELTNAVKELEGKISAVEEAYKAADAQLKKDLQNSVAELKKSITIVTVILGIISAALAGCVVFIFIKKK